MRLKFDHNKCLGCKLCEQVCSLKHDSHFSAGEARINIELAYTADDIKVKAHLCSLCMLCAKKCPEGAISKVDGRLVVDADLCTGCEVCAEICPRKCVTMREGLPVICDLCDGDPECVKWCPHNALTFGGGVKQ